MRRLLVLVFAVLAVPTAPALGADTYAVDTCATASGGPATTAGWQHEGNAYRAGISCPQTGITAVEPVAGPVYPDLIQFALYFNAPDGTRITGFRLWRSVTLTSAWTYSLHEDSSAGPTLETCGPPCNWLARPLNGPPDVSVSGRNADSVDLYASCQVRCPGGDQTLITVRRMQVDVTDDTDPTLTGTPSGDLLSTGSVVSGERTVSFSAADTGSGVYLAILEIDGKRVAANTVDTNGGRCAKPFASFAPCRASASGSISYDTAKLADGAHSARLLVTDATETNAVAYGPVQITTSNHATAPGAGAAAACPATPAPDLTARFLTTKKSTRTLRAGRTFTLAGTAPAGAPVTLLSLEARTGADWTVAGSGVAGADGAFRIAVPAGPSRSLRVAHASQAACSNVLSVKVPARVTLSAKRTAARRYRLSGRLVVPVKGKVVELQAFERGKWRTFGSSRTSASGRFAYRYTFRSESRGRTFRMRARVRADVTYPYSLGYSKTVRVRVR
jgi:hypothetical protein